MNLFLFKIYIIRGYSLFCVLYVQLVPQRQEKAPSLFSLSVPRYRQGGKKENNGTNMKMKSSMVKVKTKTS